MFKKIRTRLIIGTLQFLIAGLAYGQSSKPNILFIVVDDLNDWTGFLHGHPQIKTPNMDALAAKSVVFSRAYCNSPSCNPSRSSILLGKHPHSLGFYRITNIDDNSGTIDMRQYWPNRRTLPQYFGDNGYDTYGTGKIFHLFGDWPTSGAKTDLSFKEYNAGNGGINPNNVAHQSVIKFGDEIYKDYGAFNNPHSDFAEYGRATIAIDYLKKPHDKPFFIACGFYLPHMPWYYPRDILDSAALLGIKDYKNVILPKVLDNDLDDLSPIGVQTARNGGTGPATWNGTTYSYVHAAYVASGKWKEAVQAYIASIYFTDLQLGRILNALNSSPYKDNTIIVLWSDHGWMLGHKEGWEKFKPWEQSIRVPFLFKIPGVNPTVIDKPVELLSIFPTLVDLTGIPKKDSLDGLSLKPLIENPGMNWDYPIVTANRELSGGWQSVRTKQYRYIRYMQNGEEELYDHTTDSLEWYNIASDPKMASVKVALNSYLPKVWTKLGSWDNWTTRPVGVLNAKNQLAANQIKVAGGKIFIPRQNDKLLDLAIYDVHGTMVFNQSGDGLAKAVGQGFFNLPSSLVGSQVYIIRLTTGSQVITGKFVLDKKYQRQK